jgi:hypothetical protein
MPVYGLIHHGQLRACPCALSGLIHGLRRLNAIRYLGFQLLATVWKVQPFLSFLNFSRIPCFESCLHSLLGFSRCSRWSLHGHRLHTLSILEKLYSLLLHVESNRFLVLLKFLSCCWPKECVTTVATGVVGGSFAFLTGTNEVGTLESRCQNFSLSLILFLSSSCRV